MTHQRVAIRLRITSDNQHIIAGDQAYEYVIGKFVQLTALYEDFRAYFSNSGFPQSLMLFQNVSSALRVRCV